MLDEGARSALAITRFTDVRWFPQIDSTNRYLLDEARAGAPEGVVAVADHQTSGRGRLGRSWYAPPSASLLLSVLLRLPLAPDELHLANAAVALSAADACRQVAAVEAQLKWPNDLVVGGRKLAGVLAESLLPSSSAPASSPAVVVGIGVNLNWPEEVPAELAGTAVTLGHLAGGSVDRLALLVSLLVALETRCRVLGSAGGPAALAREYRTRCSTVGQRVRVELPDETFTGAAVDLTDQGHLMVSTDTCLRTVAAGDVHHLRSVPHPR